MNPSMFDLIAILMVGTLIYSSNNRPDLKDLGGYIASCIGGAMGYATGKAFVFFMFFQIEPTMPIKATAMQHYGAGIIAIAMLVPFTAYALFRTRLPWMPPIQRAWRRSAWKEKA